MRRAVTLLAAMGLVILLAGATMLLAGILPSGTSRAEAQPSESTDQQRATAETKSGVLNLRYGDPKLGPDGDPHGTRRIEYVLTDGKGQETELQLSEQTFRPLGGPLSLNGKGIEVEGTEAPGGKFKVETIRRDQQSDAASAFEADALTGSRPNASILCRFGDSTGVTPHAPSWFDTEVSGASAPSLDHYWRETSYNNINLTGSQVFGWYNLPHPRSHYFNADGSANLGLLAQECTAAADANVNFPSYTNINLMFNANLDCCAWGGGYTLTADGQTRTYGTTWMPPWAYNNQYVLAHETGHSFGLPHSSGPYSTPYDSEWDPMSSGGTCSPPHSVYGCIADHTISYHKDRLAWIPASRKYTATSAADQNITLERLAMSASTGDYLMARIPIGGSSTRFYTVEARRFAGYDNIGPIPGEAVVIHNVDTTRGDRVAQVVDPDGNGNPNDASAIWLPGETFTDSTNNISIKVTGATSSGFTININPSAPSPPNDNFASAQSISASTSSINGTTRGATREINEPDHSTDTDGFSWLGDHSVWYSWTAPFSGSMSIDTCQANIDSILAVYTGSSLGSLSRVTDNNNNCPSGWGSKVSFNAVAGTTYRIAVGDAGGLRENTFTLALNSPPPANDDFANAQVLSGFSASANGRNLGATLQSGDPTTVGSQSTSHTVWYSWTAPFSGAVEMNTCTSDFDTLLGVYTGIALGSLTEVAANDDGCSTGSKVTFNSTKDTTYQILVDGFNGNQGTFTLEVIDKAPPRVTSTSPANNGRIAPGANIKATFSEPMRGSSVNSTTFKLKKAGTTTFLGATVTYDPATRRATLNPNKNLQPGRTYVVTVTTGAQDEAGNSLDQNSSLAGNQTKSWSFKVR
jgi:M6 family metalloprotease-like protein